MPPKVLKYIILNRKQETSTVTTLSIAKINGEIPRYLPGQYITIYFPDLNKTLGKQYSISSAPNEQACTISVKAVGKFSNRLCSLVPGDLISASEPEGVFYPKQTTRNIVMIAGGIGITSFRSMVFENILKNKQMRLMYSSKTSDDMPFKREFSIISQKHNSFQVEYFITQESGRESENIKYRRISKENIFKKHSQETEYLLSGSLSFVLELKNILISEGVDRAQVATESYF